MALWFYNTLVKKITSLAFILFSSVMIIQNFRLLMKSQDFQRIEFAAGIKMIRYGVLIKLSFKEDTFSC